MCLDVWDFKQPQAKWEWCWLPCRTFQRSAADAGLLHGRSEMRKPSMLAGPVNELVADHKFIQGQHETKGIPGPKVSDGLGRQRGNGIHSTLSQIQWIFICISLRIRRWCLHESTESISFTVLGEASHWELSPSLASCNAIWMRLSAKCCFCKKKKKWYWCFLLSLKEKSEKTASPSLASSSVSWIHDPGLSQVLVSSDQILSTRV